MQQRMVELQSLCSRVTSGGTPLRNCPEYFDGGTIPWIKTGEVKQGFIHGAAEHITELGLEKSSAKLIPAKSLIVAMYGDGDTAGNVAVNRIPVTTNQACCNFVVDEQKAHYLFLYYYLKANYQNLVNLKLGGSQQNLNAATLRRFPVPLFELAVQQKIAALLYAYDDLIVNNQRRIVLLESMAEEIYREWFVRMRFPQHAALKGDERTPPGWSRQPIGELAVLIKRGISPDYAERSEHQVINQKCIRDGRLSMTEARRHTSVVPDEKLLRFGDILINSTGVGTLGRAAVFDIAADGITCDSHVTILRPKDVAHCGEFLAYTIQLLQTYFESMASGSTGQAELSRELISRTKVLVPSSDLLKHFSESVAPIRRQRRLLLAQNEKLSATRDQLLPRLISGKIRVDALDIQFPPSMQSPPAEAAQPVAISG
ncbi:restriction endonuclease subunit S [Xanthomonas sacchari]|uniref:restriction endonuclease subunit S n=1 Tax=Xanthomonas sacchari TaxID=56458 RepID=UPI002254331E|nr:restriction endonuclease subunit S [Xanthomonas sacchari]MCW0464042.1 hypothetical protein [Xanthomonas sacchari]